MFDTHTTAHRMKGDTRHRPAGDRGSAMLVVMGAAALLFVIAASVIGIVMFQQTQLSTAASIERATSLAQQGMDVYLSALRDNPTYWETTPTISGASDNGTWTVVANIPASTITAVGHDRFSGQLHVIRSTARPENYSDYTIVSGSTQELGRQTAGVSIAGAVRSNAGVDLQQDFPAMTVLAAAPKQVVNGINAGAGVRRVGMLSFSAIESIFPNLYTASAQRTPWATGDSQPLRAADLVKPMTFYRDSTNPSRSSWGVPTVADPSVNVTDLVGVGVDFKNETAAEKALGIFYVRSMWSPANIYASTTAAQKAQIGRQEFIDFARQDPTWSNKPWGYPDLPGRPKSITARALSPRGSNVIYVGGDLDVYVTGEISKSVTIVSERDIYVIGSITRAKDSTATVGLIAKRNIYICSAMPETIDPSTQYQTRTGDTSVLNGDPYTRGAQEGAAASMGKAAGETMPSDVTIQASMLAVEGSIIMDPPNPDALPSDFISQIGLQKRQQLTVRGSLVAAGGIVGDNFVNESSAYGGFANVTIAPDDATGTTPPPLFPQTGTGAIVVTRWDEYNSRTDPNDPKVTGLALPDPTSYAQSNDGTAQGPTVKIIPKTDDGIPPLTLSNVMPTYYLQAVITLTATDVTNAGPGNVLATWYDVDGSTPTTYTNQIVIPPLGDNMVATRTVTYWSEDAALNVETPHTAAFQMRGRDTLPAFTTVVDSNNTATPLPNGYPQIGDPPYVVWGDFVPQFTAVDGVNGTGVNQIWVSEKRDGQQIFANDWAGSQTPLNFAPIPAPVNGSSQLSFEYFSYDKAGNREDTRTLTITQRALDTMAPIVTHDAPLSGLFVGDAVIHLTADDLAEGQGVGSITYQVDNGDWVTVKAVKVGRTMVATVTVPAPTDANAQPVNHSLTFMATDVATDRYHLPAPNTGAPTTIHFLVGPALAADTTMPQSSSDAQSSYTGPALINLFSSDPAGIQAIYWQLDGGPVNSGASVYVDSPLGSPITHQLTFWAVDTVGNVESPPKTVTFVSNHEVIPPVTFAHNQDLYATSPAVFQLTSQDNDGGSGVASTYYTIDGGAPILGVTTPLGVTWVTVPGDGRHHIEFWSVDRAGNVESRKSCDFLTDTKPPVTTTDAKSTTYVGQAVITMTATDTPSGSGVAYSHWRNTADGNEQVSNPILVGPGEWDIDYWSVDKAGNAETPKRIHVSVTAGPDTFAPMSYDDIKPYYKAGSNPAALHLYSWDVQTGIQTMYYILDGGATKSMPGVGIPPANYLVTATGDGTHTIEYWAQDNANPSNVELSHHNKSFMIDTIYPVTTCDAAAGADYWASKTFNLQASDVGSGLKGTYFTLDDGAVVQGTAVYVAAPTNGYPTQHVLRYWSEDKAGNVETAHSITFTSHPTDLIPPTTYSNVKSSYFGTAIISLFAYDNVGGSGIADTHFIVDSGKETTGNLVLATGSGMHTLEFWSVDKAGNVELPHTVVNYSVDYFGPQTVCDGKRWYNTQPVQVHLQSQAISGRTVPAFTAWRLDGSGVTTGSIPATLTINGEGDHTIQFWSTDGYGNVEATKTANVGIDLWPPVTTSNSAAAYVGSADFQLIAVDQVGRSGVAATYWRASGDATATLGTQVHVAGPGGSQVATKTVTFWSVDNAGNVEGAHTVSFFIGPDAGMTFSGWYPGRDTTITTRDTTVSCIATSTQKIVSALGMLDGVPMPTVFSTGTTQTGGNGYVPFNVSGGSYVYTSGSNTVVMFQSSGTFNVSGALTGATVLVVGGGGGGGAYSGGGGGAGQYVLRTGVTLNGNNTVTVGNGGAAPTGTSGTLADNATAGQTSSAFGISAVGGQPGTSKVAGASGQGYAGGATNASILSGGGGGGSAGVGAAGTTAAQAAGGLGTASTISGSSVTYAAGGMGAYYYQYVNGSAGAPNTGNGGNAGSAYYSGGAGGSGVVIISFPTPTGMPGFASGGTKTTKMVNGVSYDVVTFTSSSQLYVAGTIANADILVVGGGGGGATNLSGGGGGGGVLSGKATLSGIMSVTVGGGGSATYYDPSGCTSQLFAASNGGDSVFAGLTAIGGGHGGQRDIPDNATVGGSGGGGCGAYMGGSVGAAGTAGQGNRGGDGSTTYGMAEVAGGGGGGAGTAGKPGVSGPAGSSAGIGGAGGDGQVSTITGQVVYYGGGGGGGSYGTPGQGGLGGGGNGEGASGTIGGTGGTSGLGGGGGAGADGGSGVVIISYPTPQFGPSTTIYSASAAYRATTLLDGPHWASFTFTNDLGQSSSTTWRFFVAGSADTKPPVSSSDVTATAIYTTGSGSTLTGFYTGAATVHLSAVDDPGGTGVAGLSYAVDGGSTQVALQPTATVTVGGSGMHTIEYWAQDRAGNVETPHNIVRVGIDTTPPKTTSDVVPSYKGFATISLNATDGVDGSGVKTTYYTLDGPPSGTSTFSWTGGTASVVGSRTVVTFTGSGSLVCSGTLSGAQVLIVGGGGGGCYGGGGGGGVVAGTVNLSGTMPVTVGTGGSGSYWTGDVCSPVLQADNGANSVFAGMTAYGGGAGANYALNGSAGGSGGGGGHGGATYGGSSTQGNYPSLGGLGFGFSGGGSAPYTGSYYPCGGGGGAGGIGRTPPSNLAGGDGGPGYLSSISGAASYYGGGGGGGLAQSGGTGTAGGAGGSGGGGKGSNGAISGATAGATSTGGGGGGGSDNNAGASGGSGIVIISFPTPVVAAKINVATGPVVVPGPLNGPPVTHSIYYWSVDNVGNIETSSTASFSITSDDRTPPQTVCNGKNVYNAPATITLTATDLGSGVAYTKWRLTSNGVAGALTTGTAVPTGAQGAYTLEFWSMDVAGNKETTQTFNYVVDQTAPQTSSDAVPLTVVAPVTTTTTSSVVGTQTFPATSADQTFTVPAGITTITVTLNGAAGGLGWTSLNTGGLGGRVSASIPVTPGTTLKVRVGKAGGPSGYWVGGSAGWPNGGSAAGGTAGGGGGGSSSILIGTTVLVEAGGGGGAAYNNGGAGGAQGTGSGPGNQTGAACITQGGAGGGGWNAGLAEPGYGGTVSGGPYAGGQGGSSYVATGTGTLTAGVNAGDGSVTIAYGQPTTQSVAGAVTIHLFASDSHVGGSGVAATYYQLDNGSTVSGNSVVVPGPLNGSQDHRLVFWSVDNATNIETPSKVATFTLVAQTAQMVWSAETPAPLSIVRSRNPVVSVIGESNEVIVSARAWLDGVEIMPPTLTLADAGSSQRRIAQFSTANLTDGSHTVSFSLITASGRQADHAPWTFVVAGPDTIPPVTTSDVKASYMGTATITLSATDASPGVRATYFQVDGGATTTGTVITVAPPAYGLAVKHNIKYWSVDGFNNVEPQNSATFTVAPTPDNIPPTTVSDAQLAYDGPATIHLTATDNPGGWGVSGTFYRLDGGAVNTYGSQIVVDPPGLANATHTLEFWSMDRAGNEESPHTTVSFVINSLADYIAPTTLTDIQRYYRTVYATIHLYATDNQYGSGVDYTRFRQTKNGTAGAWTTGTVLPAGGEGAYTLEYFSADRAGNVETTKSTDYWVDTTPPVTTTDATSTYLGPAQIDFFGTDGTYGSGVYRTWYNVDGTGWVFGYSTTIPDQITGTVSHYIDYYSTDNAGNVEPTKRINFTVQARPADIHFSNWTPPKFSIVNVRNPYVSVEGIASQKVTNVAATLDGRVVACGKYYNTADGTDCVGYFNTSGLTDTTHTVTFTYTIANGATATESWTFAVIGPDNVPPVTTLLDLQPSYVGTATIHASAVDYFPAGVPSGFKATYYILNGDIQRTSTTASTTIVVSPPAYGTVTRTLTYWSVDNAGNYEGQRTVSFSVTASPDTTPPTTVSDAVATYNGTAGIKLTATDNIGGWGVDHTDYRVSMISPTPSAGTTFTSTTAVTQIPSILGPRTGSASYRLYFRSVDRAGNVELTKSADFTINAATDTTPPVTTINAQSRYSGPGYTITLSATDIGQGVQYTHYILSDGTTTSPETSGTTIITGNQGSYTLQYWSKDWAGNKEATQTYTYVVDQTAPTTTSDRKPLYQVSATLLLTAVDSHVGASGISYTSYRIDSGATKTFVDYGWPLDPFISAVTVPRNYASGPPEVHSLTYWSTDKVGWSEAAKTVTFTITATTDTVPPVTTTDRKPYYAGPSIVQLTATDAGWGVAYTNWRLDNGAVMTGTLAGTGGSGPHTLYYWSTDNAGNVEPTNSTTFTIDTTAPITSVVSTQTTYSGSAASSLTATDPLAGSGVAATYYSVDSGTQVKGSNVFIAGPQSGTATHTLDFWSVDNVGNAETPRRVTFTITAVPDTTAPTLSDTHVAAYSKPATFALNAADAGWGVATIRYRLDGGAVVTGYNASSPGVASASCQVPTGGGTPSPHTLVYWATDQAGNTTTNTITYTVAPDTTPPITTSNAQPLYTTGPAQILLTAVDTGWGVQYTHFILNGGVETSGTYIAVADPLIGSVDATLTYWSVDWAGNIEAAHTATFTVRAIPSQMTFSNITPPENSVVGTTTTSVSVTAASNLAITMASFKVDGQSSAPTTFTASGVTATAALKVTGLTPGLHTVTATFTTSDGRQNAKTWSFTCTPRTDYTAPMTIADVKPSYWGTATITLTAGDEVGGSGVDYTRYKVDSGAWTTGTAPSTRLVIAAPVAGSPVPHSISFFSVDKAGNVESTATINFTVGPLDVTAPVTGSNAKLYYQGPGIILLMPTDTNGSGVAATYYMLDGDTTGTVGTMVGTGGVGEHTLTFWSVDNAGNVESPNVVHYIVDSTAPVTSNDILQVYSGPASIHLTAVDEPGGSGVYQTYYNLDSGGQVTGSALSVQAPVSGQQAHTITFWSVDNAGNVEAAQTVTFYVKAVPDTTPPTTSIDYKTTYAVPGLITLSAVDNPGGWGVASTHYMLDQTAEQVGLKVATGGPGTHTLKFWSIDKADNAEKVNTVTYTVLADDTTPPKTSADTTDGAQFVGAAKISLTATDNCGAPSVTWYQLDGGTATTGTVVNVPGPMSDSATHTLTFWSVDFNGVIEDKTAPSNTIHFTCNKYATNMTYSAITPADKSTVLVRNPVISVTASGVNPMVGAALTIDTVSYTPAVTLNGNAATLSYQADHLLSGTVHTVVATFMDSAGGVSAKTWTFTVAAPPDTTLPVSSSDAAPFYRGPAAIHISSTDEVGGSGVAQTYYRVDGGSQVSGTPPTTTVSVTAEGPHWIEFWAVDVSGNTELPHHTIGFNIDLTPPRTSSDAILAYDGPATINLTPDDGTIGSGVAGTHFVVDAGLEQSGTVITVPAPSTGSQWHVAYFWSFDRAGNVETTQSVMFNVWAPSGTTVPTMGVLRLASILPPKTTSDALGSYTTPSLIHLTATAGSAGRTIAHTYYVLDGGAPVESTVLGTGGTGTHTLSFWSVDSAGLAESMNTITYVVAPQDMIAPRTTSDAAASYSGIGEIHLTATDEGGSGVAHTYYRMDGGPQVESTLIGVSGVGDHQLVYWSVDWAGNVEAPTVVDYKVTEADLVAPLTTTDALASYTGTATVSLTATDAAGSGVRSTYYRLDSGPEQEGTQIQIAPPASGSAQHDIVFWSVDMAGNIEPAKSVTFQVAAIPDSLAPVTTSDALASYAGTATIDLTASDGPLGSGVATTYYNVDGGPQQVGVTVIVPAPGAGDALHHVTFWSVDRAGNAEAAKTVEFTVHPAGPLAYLTFTWGGTGTVALHVENAAGMTLANVTRTGTGSAIDWVVAVPAGASYKMVCDSATGRAGSSSAMTPVLGEGQGYTWSY